jgi:hypothetical protein
MKVLYQQGGGKQKRRLGDNGIVV